MGRAPLSGFCNRHCPRAQPGNSVLSVEERAAHHHLSPEPKPERRWMNSHSSPNDPPFAGQTSRALTSQGPLACEATAPLATIARSKGFTPTRSARTPPVANPMRMRRMENPSTHHRARRRTTRERCPPRCPAHVGHLPGEEQSTARSAGFVGPSGACSRT